MAAVRGRRYIVIVAILAGIVGLYAAVGFLLVPRWTRQELIRLTSQDFGRTLSLGDVRFNPFTWTLRIADFSLPDADGRPMIAFKRLAVAVGISSVTRLAPSLRYIVLDGPHVSAVVRRDGRLNFADLEKPFARPAEAKAQPSKPFKLYVDRLTVENGSATYEDDSRPKPFRLALDPIAFQLLNFSTAGSQAGSYHLNATIGQGGRLDWAGTVREAPLSLRGTLELDALSAQTVADFLGPVLPAEVSQGAIALRGSFAIEGPPQGSATQGVRMTIDVPQAQVSGLGVRPRGAASDYVQIGRLTLGNAHIDLEQRAIRVGNIALAGVDVHGWLDPGGQLNLLQLLSPAATPSGSAPAVAHGVTPPAVTAAAPRTARTPAWTIAAPDIRIADSRVSFQDRTVQPAADLTLSAIGARITGYETSPQSHIGISLQSAVNGKGQIRLTAAGTLSPEALNARLSLTDIDLRALQPYLNKYTALTLSSGLLASTLDVGRSADGRLSASGRIDVTDLRTVDDALKRDFIKWRALHLAGFRYVSKPASLRIERIVAVAPYARVIIGADHILNVSEALHPRGAPKSAPAATTAQAKSAPAPVRGKGASHPGSAAMAMSIGLVRIAGGTADYADFSMQPNFATGIENLHGTIKGLSSNPSSRASVKLRGEVGPGSPVDISGMVNVLAASAYTDLRMKFSNLELTSMTPYAVRFAGYQIASGMLDANLHYKVDHGRLDADHVLVIKQLQLGDRVESAHATHLPLKLAVALLKDRDGIIRIGLPVTGSLSNPQFSLGPLIGKALLHILMKAVTAPFAMLSHLVGGGADINRIDFAPGSATLLPAARGQTAALAKALAQRPQLKLQVPAVFAPDVDRPALAKRQLRDELLALARSGAVSRESRHRFALSRKKASPPPPVGPEVLELPMAHYRLLRAAYLKSFGPKAPLPTAAQKVPPIEPAILELQSALLKRMQVSDTELKSLGERRAEAIRTAILAAGGVDAGRIGISAPASQSASAGQVAVKLGLQ